MNRKMVQLSGLAFLLFVLEATTCWACRAAPQEQLMSANEQIILASDISVARVVSATPTIDGKTEYEFIVQRRIKGANKLFFAVTGSSAPQKDTSFNNHENPEFWQRGGGRLSIDTECVIHPNFIVGDSYIAFIGLPITKRSFEKIETPNGMINLQDKWLLYVETKLHGLTQKE